MRKKSKVTKLGKELANAMNGGEYLGYSTKGFDYNGAWGGPAQNGKSIPKYQNSNKPVAKTAEQIQKEEAAALAKQRKQELLDSAKQVAQGSKDLENHLIMAAYMENNLGENPKAYGRNYTKSMMSIDDVAFKDLFDKRGEKDYTSSQKKYFDWLQKDLKLDPTKMDSLLTADNPTAAMAAARMVYGRTPKALPKSSDSKAMYDYYLEYYNKFGANKYETPEQGYKRFQEGYDKYVNPPKKQRGDIVEKSNLWETDKVGYIDSTLNANKDKRWVQRLYEKNPEFYLPNETEPSTHYMESGDSMVYPTIVENQKGGLEYNREEGRKQAIQFPNDDIAQWFGKNYKLGTNVLQKHKEGGWLSKYDKAQDGYNLIPNNYSLADLAASNLKDYSKQFDPGVVAYGTPEYQKAYAQNRIVSGYNAELDAYNMANMLEPVTITPNNKGTREQNIRDAGSEFWNTTGELYSEGSERLVQGLTGKKQLPAEAWGFKDPGDWQTSHGWEKPITSTIQSLGQKNFYKNTANFLLNAGVDPFNAVGAGLLKPGAKALAKSSSKQLGAFADDVGKGLTQVPQASTKPFFDHLGGLGEAIFNPSRYPLTVSRRAKLIKEQDDVLKKAVNFTEEWNFNPDGTINNSVKQRMKNLTEDKRTKEALDLYNRGDNSIYNPMEKPNKLVSSRRKDLEKADISDYDKEYITNHRGRIAGVNTSANSITLRNIGNYYYKPKDVAGTVVHEGGHSTQDLGQIYDKGDWTETWGEAIGKVDENYGYFTANKETEAGREFAKHMIEPKMASPGSNYHYDTWLSSPKELHSDLMTARFNLVEELSKNQTKEVRDNIINRLKDAPTDADIDLLLEEDLNKFFKPSTSKEDKRKLIRMLPALFPATVGTGAASQMGGQKQEQQEYKNGGWLNKYQDGGIIEDDRGQWAHPGEVTQIDSPNITMKNVPYPVLGISDTGDQQMMYPEQDYKFKGSKVTEYPILENGGWLGKYETAQDGTSILSYLNPKNWGVPDLTDKYKTQGEAYKNAPDKSEFLFSGVRIKKDTDVDNQLDRRGLAHSQNKNFWREYKTSLSEDYPEEEIEKRYNDALDLHYKYGNPKINLLSDDDANAGKYDTEYSSNLKGGRSNYSQSDNSMQIFYNRDGKLDRDFLIWNYTQEMLHARQRKDMGLRAFNNQLIADLKRLNVTDGDGADYDAKMYSDPQSIESVHDREYWGLKRRMDRNYELEESSVSKEDRASVLDFYKTDPFDPYKNQPHLRIIQKALTEKGYKLPNSVKADGTFDGIYGDETKKALIDYQSGKKQEVSKKQHGGTISSNRNWLNKYK